MIREYVMRLGSFDVTLKKTTPRALLRRLRFYGHFVFTPTRVYDIATQTDLLNISTYTGVYTNRTNYESYSGPGLSFWLGDDQGRGRLIAAGTLATDPGKSLSDWVTYIISTNDLTVGSVQANPTLLQAQIQYMSRRTALDYITRYYGVEWRITPSGLVDVGNMTYLYGTDAKAIITPQDSFPFGAELRTFTAVQSEYENDVEGMLQGVYVKRTDGSITYREVDESVATYYTLKRSRVMIREFVDPGTVEATSAPTVGDQILARRRFPRKYWRINSNDFYIDGPVSVGSNIHVFDPENGLLDADNPVDFRGSVVFPVKVRIVGFTRAVTEGMGVYYISPDQTAEIIDLSDWVEWEEPALEFEFGSAGRRVSDEADDADYLFFTEGWTLGLSPSSLGVDTKLG